MSLKKTKKQKTNSAKLEIFPIEIPEIFHTNKRNKAEKDILQAALKEFAAYGLTGARIDRIAKASSYNKAMIYYYFKSKEKLYEAVIFNLDVQDWGEESSSHPLLRFYNKYVNNQTIQFEGFSQDEYFSFLENYVSCISETFSLRSEDYNKLIVFEIASGGKYLFQVRDKVWIPGFKIFDSFLSFGLEKKYLHFFNSYFLILSLMGTLLFYYVHKPILKNSELDEKLYFAGSDEELKKHLFGMITMYKNKDLKYTKKKDSKKI